MTPSGVYGHRQTVTCFHPEGYAPGCRHRGDEITYRCSAEQADDSPDETRLLVPELREKHDVDDAVSLIDGSHLLKNACRVTASVSDMDVMEIEMSVGRVLPRDKTTNYQVFELSQQRRSRHRRQLASVLRLRMKSAYLNTTSATRIINMAMAEPTAETLVFTPISLLGPHELHRYMSGVGPQI